MIKLSILIPVRNESINIRIMLKILLSILEISHEILIIYDSSSDNTIPVAKKMMNKYPNIRLIHNTLGAGVANAIKSGVKASKGKYILIFAADEVGPVLAIDDMVTLIDEGCDFVSCTRYAYGGRRLGGSAIGGFLSRTANFLFHEAVGSALTDSTTGIKIFRKEVIAHINLESRIGWAVVFELAIKAQMKGLILGEVPIISIDRLYGGKSSYVLSSWIKEYLRWFFYGVKNIHKLRSNKKVVVRIPKSSVI